MVKELKEFYLFLENKNIRMVKAIKIYRDKYKYKGMREILSILSPAAEMPVNKGFPGEKTAEKTFTKLSPGRNSFTGTPAPDKESGADRKRRRSFLFPRT